MISKLIEVAYRVSPGIRRSVVRILYQYLSRLDRDGRMAYMNYGYADLDPRAATIELSAADEADRYCIQLYHHVAGAVDLGGLDVLEVGSGRGGGASYIARYLQPRSLVGVDISERAVEFCNRHYAIPGLTFTRGDSESLPFDDSVFDVVVNVESSHGYGAMERFLAEVLRVLRPNGLFLFADFRRGNAIDSLRDQLVGATLEIWREEHITANVLRALDLDNDRKLKLIEQNVPLIMRRRFRRFAGIKGTKIYEALRTGDLDYRSFVLRKAARG